MVSDPVKLARDVGAANEKYMPLGVGDSRSHHWLTRGVDLERNLDTMPTQYRNVNTHQRLHGDGPDNYRARTYYHQPAYAPALFIPLIAAAVWAVYLLATNGSDPSEQLSPSSIKQTLFFLSVFAGGYLIFVLSFLMHKKHEHKIMVEAIKSEKVNKKAKKKR